jgi:ABC-type multidrug transport system fused ATPase/permease subunit
VKLTVRQTLFSLCVNMTTAAGTALVLGFGSYRALNGELTAGQLLVVLSYVAAVYKPLEAISHTIGSLQDKLVGVRMAFNVLDTQPVIRESRGAKALAELNGRVVFENVCFSYPGRVDTLKDISFDAPPGHVIAIVGATGAGKTTLANLIPRFYDPVSGRILIDGHDIRSLTLRSLREHVSLVPQEPVLFAGTIADNIRYGRLDATMDEVVAAAMAANAHDFIARLGEGYQTHTGERGARLSGGERQRICIARAFLKNAGILILDEPTASIDSRTEAVILEALDRLMAGRTTFMIAHRLSTIHHADVILVMDHGAIVERGPHDALLGANGVYAQLHHVQNRTRERRRPQPVTLAAGGVA